MTPALKRSASAALVLILPWAIVTAIGLATGSLPPRTPADDRPAARPQPRLAVAPPATPAAPPAPHQPSTAPPPSLEMARVCALLSASARPQVAELNGTPPAEILVPCDDGLHLIGVDVGGALRRVALASSSLGISSFLLGDLDGDLAADLLLGLHAPGEGETRSELLWMRRERSGGFLPPQRLASVHAIDLALVDLDGASGSELAVLVAGDPEADRPGALWIFAGGPAPLRLARLSTHSSSRSIRTGPTGLTVVSDDGSAVDLLRENDRWSLHAATAMPEDEVPVAQPDSVPDWEVGTAIFTQALDSETSVALYHRQEPPGVHVVLLPLQGAPAPTWERELKDAPLRLDLRLP